MINIRNVDDHYLSAGPPEPEPIIKPGGGPGLGKKRKRRAEPAALPGIGVNTPTLHNGMNIANPTPMADRIAGWNKPTPMANLDPDAQPGNPAIGMPKPERQIMAGGYAWRPWDMRGEG